MTYSEIVVLVGYLEDYVDAKIARAIIPLVPAERLERKRTALIEYINSLHISTGDYDNG